MNLKASQILLIDLIYIKNFGIQFEKCKLEAFSLVVSDFWNQSKFNLFSKIFEMY